MRVILLKVDAPLTVQVLPQFRDLEHSEACGRRTIRSSWRFYLRRCCGTILEEAMSLSEYETKNAEIRRKGSKIVIIPILR